ncbi:MAG: hypothetical protein ABJZ55_26165 [Fuerstiella sp.]
MGLNTTKREFKPLPAGGGGIAVGARLLYFRIREVDCYTGDWYVDYSHISDCEEIPDQRADGLIRVRPGCCLSPFTTDELIASGYGVATYVFPKDSCGMNGQWREIIHCADDGCDSQFGSHEECTS